MQEIMKKMRGQSGAYPQKAPNPSDRPDQAPQAPPNMEDAMKKGKDAMKMLENMFKK
jgi:hypothetical protein